MVKALNLGCGKNFIESTPEVQWINIDVIKEFKADLYHDLSEPLPFDDESVDCIKCFDIIEHFTKYDIEPIFRGWVKLLKKGGIMEAKVPNIDVIKSFNGDMLISLIFGEQMFSGVNTGVYGIHKMGYNKNSLELFMVEHGLKIIEIKGVEGTNLYAKGEKV